MSNLKKAYEYIFPKYTRVPLLTTVIISLIGYYGLKVVQLFQTLVPVWKLPIDDKIPFIPEFIFVYVIAFAQWVIGFIIIAREDRPTAYRVLSADIMGKLIAFALFIIFPLTMGDIRPKVTPTDFPTWVCAFIFSTDTTTNLFPSLHCFESWIVARGSMGLKKVPKWYIIMQTVLSVGIFFSTVFVKQHVVLDVISGIVLVEIVLFISRKADTARVYFKWEEARNRRHAEKLHRKGVSADE